MPRFCTAIVDGQRCPGRTRPGHAFCMSHSEDADVFRRCQYFNRHGQQCRATPIRGQDHCFTHSRRNHRAKLPAIPIIPRTRRQKALAKWFCFNAMPHS
jgi:hypothetical protein